MNRTQPFRVPLSEALARDYTPEEVRLLVTAGYGLRAKVIENEATIAWQHARIRSLEAEYAGALETAEEAEREANEVWTS